MIKARIDVRHAFIGLFQAETPRFTVVVAHRRAGKTVCAIQRLISAALSVKSPNGRYAFIAPLRLQSKNIAWDYLKRMTQIIPGSQANESELRVDLINGSRIQLYGADNPDSLRGGYLDGCVMDEFAQMDPRTWDNVVRPMLSDRIGWAMFIGTPAGRNAFADLYDLAATEPGWGRWLMRADETNIVDKGEIDVARREMSPEAFAQEYLCSWTAAIRGAFYGPLMEQAEAEGRVCDLPVIPSAWTVTSWDLGVRDATAIWIIQQDGPWFNAIDYIESSGVGLDWYAKELTAKGYRYDQHIAPPDIAVVELGTGRSRIETARGMGIRFDVCRTHGVADGIQAMRNLIPRMRFDRVRCERGIKALQLYRQEWDQRLSALRANPLHDWTSHAADAARYWAMADIRIGVSPYDDPRISPNVTARHADNGMYRRNYSG